LAPEQDKELDDDKGVVDVAALVRVAVEKTGTPHKIAAAMVGYGSDYWARVLTNERGIVLRRLGNLPVDVQRRIVAQWAEALGGRFEQRDKTAMREIARTLAEAAARLAEVV
jgi:hypothetical protein